MIKDLPIISAYCMTMPLTGSYYGYLAAVAYDGTPMSEKQLKRNYHVFTNVKRWASTFVQDYAVKLYSPDKIVNHSLVTARQDKSYAHVKKGLFSRFWQTTREAIESVFG